MELTREWISILAEEGTVLPTYNVEPLAAKERLPNIVLIQEAFGADAHIQDVADRLASAGYRVFAPDLWSLGGVRPPAASHARMADFKRFVDLLPPGGLMNPEIREALLTQLAPDLAASVREALGFVFSQNRELLPKHLRHVVSYARRNGRSVGTMGFCMGGGFSAQLAFAESAPDAAVVYYGMAPPVERAGELRCPVLAFVADAERDPQITGAALAMAERLPGRFIAREYKGALHAFNNDTRTSYHPSAARDAWARMLAFFADRL